MSACNVGDLGSIPGSGRSPGEGTGNPLQYSCLENPMDGEAWWATVHRVAKSLIRLSNFTFFHFQGKDTQLLMIVLIECVIYILVFHLNLPIIIQEGTTLNFYLDKKIAVPKSCLIFLRLHS